MATQAKTQSLQTLEQVGRILARRLREARKRQGWLHCPVCLAVFEGTHLVKCPECRTLISKSFEEIPVPDAAGKMELDFFPQT